MTDFTKIHPDFHSVSEAYEHNVLPILQGSESDRVKALKTGVILRAVLLPIAILFSLFIFIKFHPALGLIFAVCTVSLSEFIARRPITTLRKKLQSAVLPLLAKPLGLRFQHTLHRPPHFNAFRKYKVVPAHDRRRFEDLLQGERHGLSFDLYEAYLEREDTDSDGDTTWVTVFHGMMLRVEYPREFFGATLIRRDSKFLKLSPLGRDYKRIELSSPKFEKAFDAWTTDQTEAHYLLDPLKLERFLALEEIYRGKELKAAFADGALFIAIKSGDIMSMSNMKKSLEDAGQVESLLREFAAIYDLIDVLVKPVDRKISGAFEVSDIRTPTDLPS